MEQNGRQAAARSPLQRWRHGPAMIRSNSTRPRRALALTAATALTAVIVVSACSSQDTGQELTGAAATGQALAESYNCASCHTTDGTKSTGPTWKDLAGSEVELTNGETVTADGAYIRRSITDPAAEVVEGFNPTMPAFDLDGDELDALTAYIESLGAAS